MYATRIDQGVLSELLYLGCEDMRMLAKRRVPWWRRLLSA